MFFASLSFRALCLSNLHMCRNFLLRSKFSFETSLFLVEEESSIGDVQVDEDLFRVFSAPLLNIRIDDFENDDQCESWTRFKKDELHDLIGRLELPEEVLVHRHENNFYTFHREELLIYFLTRMAFGLPHTVMADMVFGGDCSRWGKGYNYLMQHIDEKFINLININSLGIWAPYFPAFAEAMRRKFCRYWDKVNNENGMEVIENICTNENSMNVCGLFDCCVHEICRLGSGPDGEGEDCERRPDWCVKQRSVCDGHHKFHGLKLLTISFPNGMSTVVGLVSSRESDLEMLRMSELDNILHESRASNNLDPYCFYGDKGFSGIWLNIRTPRRGTLLFPLNARQNRENLIMKKVRIRVEWAYAIVKMIWKLVLKFLFFKLDQNNELCMQHLRVSHLLCNFRACYRGNSASDVTSFDCLPPDIDEHVSYLD